MREDDAGEDGDVETSGSEDALVDRSSTAGSERVVTPPHSVTDAVD